MTSSWKRFNRGLPLALSVVALVVAVFGSTPLGRAAKGLVIPPHSVGTAQLKKNAVTGAKVRNGSLLAVDFKRGQLKRGPAGQPGPAGAPGPKGDKGDQGDPATALWGVVASHKLKRGNGITGVAQNAVGLDVVTFSRDLSDCAVLATPETFKATTSAKIQPNNHDVVVFAVDKDDKLSDFAIAAFC